MGFENIIVQSVGHVGVIQLDRPEALNALNTPLIQELEQALKGFETNDDIGSIILTGNEKAFAAGADIKEMSTKTYMDAFLQDFITDGWEAITKCRKPVIAAVAGYALGGGCELAMMCDFIIAADTARFGQPEISVGIIPGAGGTQRLARAVGKAKAMEMCLTGRQIDAEEAERCGLVSRVVPADNLLDEALKAASNMAKMSRPAIMMIKECIDRSYETPLREGLLFERRLFHSIFATEDQKEGMQSFIEKREPSFKNR